MSSIGKMLIWINAILAFAFLGAASAVVFKSGDFKKKYDEEVAARKQDGMDAQKKWEDLNAKYTTLQKVADDTRREKENLRADLESKEKGLELERAANAQLRGSVDAINANLDNYRATNADLLTKNENLHKEIGDLRTAKESATMAAEKAMLEKSEAVATAEKAKAEFAALQDNASSSIKERDSLKAKLETIIKLTGVPGDMVQAQPLIEGAVTDIADDIGLVALSVGKAQGVQPGFSFDIYKGNEYKGKATVDTVQENYCSAKITMRVPGKSIGKGDSVTTRL